MAPDGDPFAGELLAWFAGHGRHDLPWQQDRDPYRIWISEIMLQQTQVATVIPYFLKFIERFPTVTALAAAPLDQVLAHWSGLGYYARARNLHKAAVRIRDDHEGLLPQTPEVLMSLPGIGRSTAAAILALTRDEPHAILDGNVKRVLARVHAVRGWSGRAEVLAALWSLAEAHTPAERAAEYTQAIMDLGATVCTRSNPSCEVCPVAARCRALATGIVAELPTPRPKRTKPRRTVTVALVYIEDGQTGHAELLLERRPPAGLWGGLLSLPEIPGVDGSGEGPVDSAGAAEWCRETFGVTVAATAALEPIEHSFTHFDLTLTPLAMRVAEKRSDREDSARIVLDRDRWLWYKAARPLPGGMAAPIEKLIREHWPAGGSGRPRRSAENQTAAKPHTSKSMHRDRQENDEGDQAA